MRTLASGCVWHAWNSLQRGGGNSISITEMVNFYLDLVRVKLFEVKSRPADEERSSAREQWLSNERLRALGWKPERTLPQAVSDQQDAERKRA
ncbi:MAG: hypothetical protein WBQ08_21020 [Candidatus Sulfotelmatobacter sp.]